MPLLDVCTPTPVFSAALVFLALPGWPAAKLGCIRPPKPACTLAKPLLPAVLCMRCLQVPAVQQLYAAVGAQPGGKVAYTSAGWQGSQLVLDVTFRPAPAGADKQPGAQAPPAGAAQQQHQHAAAIDLLGAPALLLWKRWAP